MYGLITGIEALTKTGNHGMESRPEGQLEFVCAGCDLQQ